MDNHLKYTKHDWVVEVDGWCVDCFCYGIDSEHCGTFT